MNRFDSLLTRLMEVAPNQDGPIVLSGEQFSIGYGKVGDFTANLASAEKIAIQRAVSKRREEFSTGRYLAKRALAKIRTVRGDDTIPQGLQRNPLWPDGVLGSISHTDEFALAVVARKAAGMIGVGVDIETDDGRVGERLAKLLLTAREHSYYENTKDELPIDALTLLFSAKEAVFKAVFPSAGEMIEYAECDIEVEAQARRFTAKYVGSRSANAIMDRGSGYFVQFQNCVVTLFVIENS